MPSKKTMQESLNVVETVPTQIKTGPMLFGIKERVIGIDPGLQKTGYAVINTSKTKPKIVEAGVIKLTPGTSLVSRLADLYRTLCEILDEHQPGSMAVEELFSHYDRPKTAILMGHARGVVLLTAAQRGITLESYLPTRVKKFLTGSGHCSKAQMQQAVMIEFGLSKPPSPPDVADAMAIALCHAHATKLG